MSAVHSGPRDWRDLPLAPGGRSLIEASAGTGKTWTIGVLYLRLLLEQGLSPRQVVVATFTNAAADELRGRLRARLVATLALAERDAMPVGEGSDQAWLAERWADPGQRLQDQSRLRLALAELDLAPVSTLHALCSRILADHPFAAGTLFRGGDLVAAEQLVAGLARDLQRLFAADPEWMRVADLMALAGEAVSAGTLSLKLRAVLAPATVIDAVDPMEFDAAFPRELAPRLRALCAEDAYFNDKCALRTRWMELADAIDAWHAGRPTLPNGTALRVLDGARGLTKISAAGKRSAELLDLAETTVDVAARLRDLPARLVQHAWHRIQRWARAQLAHRLALANQRSFDDLLSQVHAALQPMDADDGPLRPLADALHAAWPVALIDECQDTDAVQFGILDAIYRAADGSARGRLVMIGDPKQAIYRFRGGDIHTYLRASADVPPDGRLSLDTNHRSSAAYVEALNQLYARYGHRVAPADAAPVVMYHPVRASGRREAMPLREDDAPCARPLAIHLLDVAPGAAEERRRLALTRCADAITADLVQGRRRIGDRALLPSDIAVLLPSHRDASALKSLLRERGVPCVTSGNASVFDGVLAEELLLVLHAVAHPQDPGALRAAIGTGLWGLGYHALRRLAEDTAGWQAIVAWFHARHADWQRLGLQAVVDALIDRVAPAQLGTAPGERVLTDLRHLGELLQAEASQADGPAAVLAWFGDQIAGEATDADGGEARALRIESDARRVQIMTLHASKGLEFNIVHLPLMFAHGAKRDRGLPMSTDPATGVRRLAIGEAEREAVARELLEERHRVLYVALTRAVHACHVYALAPAALKDGERHGLGRAALLELLGEVDAGAIDALRGASPCIDWIAGWEAPAGLHYDVREGADAAGRSARPLPPPPPGPLPARHSFTTLVRGAAVDALRSGESAADEAMVGLDLAEVAALAGAEVPEARTPHPALDALAAVAGADFGNAIHAILEHRAIGQPLSAQPALVREQLAEHDVRRRGLSPERLADALAQRLDAVLDAPLGGSDGPRLGALAATDLRAEIEFNYALEGASLEALREACAAHGHAGLVPAQSARLRGLMNGKIDLVFRHDGRLHVLDYKGNRLGDAAAPCLEDYAPAALEAAMDAHHYRFQALLYVVALERYLRARLGDGYRRARHLGEAWYLFVRATGLALPDGTPCGVWRHRFPDALLDAVQAVLSTRGEEVA